MHKPAPSPGSQQLNRSSPKSNDIAHLFPGHDTSAVFANQPADDRILDRVRPVGSGAAHGGAGGGLRGQLRPWERADPVVRFETPPGVPGPDRLRMPPAALGQRPALLVLGYSLGEDKFQRLLHPAIQVFVNLALRCPAQGDPSETTDQPLLPSVEIPTGFSLDSTGNIYVADWDSNRIHRIDTAGVITMFAGTGNPRRDPRVGQVMSTETCGTHHGSTSRSEILA